MSLSADGLARALQAIGRWRADPETVLPCLACGADGMSIADRSARPHAEWYQMSCRACGLDETIHIPLAPPVMGGPD